MTLEELNDKLLEAHELATNDSAKLSLLVELYTKAFQLTVKDDATAGYFYLTNAYVFALDCNHPKTLEIEKMLKQANRL